MTQEEGSVLLSCSTSLKFDVIQVPEQEPVPAYMPIYTSSLDKPSFTEQYVVYQNEIIEIYDKQNLNRIIRSKQDIKRLYLSVFTGISKFPGEPYQIRLEPNVLPRQMPYRPVRRAIPWPILRDGIDGCHHHGYLATVSKRQELDLRLSLEL